VFNSLRLSIVVATEVLTDVLTDVTVEVLIEILAAEVLIKLASGTELI
jgi:NADH:ubiquinone oxidoreductase subunit K